MVIEIGLFIIPIELSLSFKNLKNLNLYPTLAIKYFLKIDTRLFPISAIIISCSPLKIFLEIIISLGYKNSPKPGDSFLICLIGSSSGTFIKSELKKWSPIFSYFISFLPKEAFAYSEDPLNHLNNLTWGLPGSLEISCPLAATQLGCLFIIPPFKLPSTE